MSEIQDNIFQAQFSQRHSISVNGGRVEAVSIQPASRENGDLPILLAPGWSETVDVNRVPLEELYNSGRRAITLSHARRGIRTPEVSPLPKAIDRKATSLLATLDYFGINQVDIIAHSEGGINAAVLALQYPQRIRNMILIGSGGLLPQDDLLRLSARFIYEGVGEGEKFIRSLLEKVGVLKAAGKTPLRSPSLAKTIVNISKYVMSNPTWSLEENQAIARQRSINLLRALQAKGIEISFIHNVDDRIFPMKLISRDMGLVAGEGKAGFYSVVGNHNAVLGDPRVTRLAVNALDSLQYKRGLKSN